MLSENSIVRELKIMHACELGAVGVYRGHKCVARYVFRQALENLDEMRSHEVNHVSVFHQLLDDHNSSPCFGYPLFFLGGLIYGVAIGLLGLKAIGESTRTIESIVVRELDISLQLFSGNDKICAVLNQVRLDEISHQYSGAELTEGFYLLAGFVSAVAKRGAYLAKYLASIL